MPNQARYHDGDRKVVCLLCMRKCSTPLTEFQLNRIVIIYQTATNLSDAHVPQGFCEACRTIMRKDEGKDGALPMLFDFMSIKIRAETCGCCLSSPEGLYL